MGDIVNLRRVKKQLARKADAVEAAANRLLHGRTTAEKVTQLAEARRAKAQLDQARIAPDPPISR